MRMWAHLVLALSGGHPMLSYLILVLNMSLLGDGLFSQSSMCQVRVFLGAPTSFTHHPSSTLLLQCTLFPWLSIGNFLPFFLPEGLHLSRAWLNETAAELALGLFCHCLIHEREVKNKTKWGNGTQVSISP